MIAPGDRVAHAITGASGLVTHETTLSPDFAGDLAGPWVHVAFDDGLRCWCPLFAILPEDPDARRTVCGHRHYADGHCAEMSCSNYTCKHR